MRRLVGKRGRGSTSREFSVPSVSVPYRRVRLPRRIRRGAGSSGPARRARDFTRAGPVAAGVGLLGVAEPRRRDGDRRLARRLRGDQISRHLQHRRRRELARARGRPSERSHQQPHLQRRQRQDLHRRRARRQRRRLGRLAQLARRRAVRADGTAAVGNAVGQPDERERGRRRHVGDGDGDRVLGGGGEHPGDGVDRRRHRDFGNRLHGAGEPGARDPGRRHHRHGRVQADPDRRHGDRGQGDDLDLGERVRPDRDRDHADTDRQGRSQRRVVVRRQVVRLAGLGEGERRQAEGDGDGGGVGMGHFDQRSQLRR